MLIEYGTGTARRVVKCLISGLIPALTLCLNLLISAPAVAGLSDQAANYYEQGEDRFLEGDYEGALLELKNLLRIAPGDVPARFLSGRSYLRLGDAAAAENELRHALSGGADANLVLLPLGTALLMQGKYLALINTLNPQLTSPETRPQIHLMRARAYLSLEDLPTARREFEFARQLLPNSAAPLLGQARISLRLGDSKTALELVLGATAVEPEDPNGWYLLAELQRLQGDQATALKNYTRALDMAPNLASARVGRAATLIDLGRDDEAFADIEYLRKRLPKDPQANYLLALLKSRSGEAGTSSALLGEVDASLAALDTRFLNKHAPSLLLYGIVAYRQNRFDEAIEHLQRFIGLRPHHSGGRKLLADIFLQQGKTQAAIDILKPEVAHASGDAELLEILGKAYALARNFKQAQAALRKALAIAPSKGALAMQLAQSLRATGLREEARDVLWAALERSPDNLNVGLMLGQLYLELGENPQAILLARRLYKQHPRKPAVFTLAGRAQMQRGRVLGARTAFEQALMLDVKYLPARLGLASLAATRGDYAEAQQRFQRILGEHPNEISAMAGLANIATLQGRNDDAIAWLENVRAADTASLSPMLALIGIYLRRDLPVKARAVLADLELAHKGNPAVMLARARVELAMHANTEARITLNNLAQRVSKSAPWLYRTALLQISAADNGAARTTLSKATQVDSSYIPAHQELVALELKMNRIDDAQRHAQALRKRYPALLTGYMLTGDVYMALQQYPKAIAIYRQGLNKKPSELLILRLAQALNHSGKSRESQQILEKWLQLHPRQKKIRQYLSAAYLAAGNLTRAQASIADFLKRYPRDITALNNLAWLQLRGGHRKSALKLAQKAYQLAPQDASVLDTLGWIYVRSGQNSQGLEMLGKAHLLAADEPQVRYHLAVALSNSGQLSLAVEHLQAALQSKRKFEAMAQAKTLLQQLKQN